MFMPEKKLCMVPLLKTCCLLLLAVTLLRLWGRPELSLSRAYTGVLLFFDPLPPKCVLKMLIFLTAPYENTLHHNQHFKKRKVSIDPLPFCTFSKMMTILDDRLH